MTIQLGPNELKKRIDTANAQCPRRSLWLHKKSGGTYRVERVALREEDAYPVIIYYLAGNVDVMWVRPWGAFLKNFELLDNG